VRLPVSAPVDDTGAKNAGHNRFTGTAIRRASGGGSGPHVVPGRYEVRLSIERAGKPGRFTVPLDVRI